MAFNKLSDSESERLDILSEECAEVIKAIAKIKRHGWDSYNPDLPEKDRISNRRHLEKELGDVTGVMHEMCSLRDLRGGNIEIDGKSAWIGKLPYTHHQTKRPMSDPEMTRRSALWVRRINTWTEDDLYSELAYSAGRLAETTEWGAAVGEYQKSVKLIQGELSRRQRALAPGAVDQEK